MNNKLSIKHWLSFIIAGLVGQFAWTIENMFINRYLFYTTQDLDFIAPMVALSALTATITTLFMGALSDRLGKRKLFISFGYIIWGITIIAFAFLNPHQFGFLQNSLFLCGVLIVVMDCIMTFFGSTANDAAFNAFVTDVTNNENRGKVESVLSILPLVAMLIIFGFFNGMTTGENPSWGLFYAIFGVLTIVAGVASIFLIPKEKIKPNKEESYFKNIFYGFRPKTIKNNPMLYIVLIAFCLFSIAIQIFFPYFLIYIEKNLGIVNFDYIITLGSVLLVACILTVVVGLFMDKIGKTNLLIPSLVITIVGAVLMFFAKEMAFIIVAGIVLMTGYMVSTAVLNAKIRDYTPSSEAGLFQGVRMIFAVLIPMVSGPYIGEALYKSNQETYVNEFGQIVTLPNENIFIGAAGALVFAIIPIIFIILKEKRMNNEVRK
jgi:MFS family permease